MGVVGAYSSVDAILPVLYEDWDFAGAGGFEDFRELGYCLLEDLWGADVDFRDDDHDGDVEGEGDAEVLSTSDQDVLCHGSGLETYLLIPTRPLFAATINRQ